MFFLISHYEFIDLLPSIRTCLSANERLKQRQLCSNVLSPPTFLFGWELQVPENFFGFDRDVTQRDGGGFTAIHHRHSLTISTTAIAAATTLLLGGNDRNGRDGCDRSK